MKNLCSVLLPAYNEEDTINECCSAMIKHPLVTEVIVVANCCDDKTASIAKKAGAKVIETTTKGKGYALKAGIAIATQPIIMCCDSDLKNPSNIIVDLLMEKLDNERVGLVKGYFDRSEHPGPVTDMMVRPMLKQINHPAAVIKQPLSGMFAVRNMLLKSANLPNNFGIDLAILLTVYNLGWEVLEAELPQINHKVRPWSHYVVMAEEIISVFHEMGYISTKRGV
jgi:glycosyltransferase involved in cell wall biosynthesis